MPDASGLNRILALAFRALGIVGDGAAAERQRADILAGRSTSRQLERFEAAKAGVVATIDYITNKLPSPDVTGPSPPDHPQRIKIMMQALGLPNEPTQWEITDKWTRHTESNGISAVSHYEDWSIIQDLVCDGFMREIDSAYLDHGIHRFEVSAAGVGELVRYFLKRLRVKASAQEIPEVVHTLAARMGAVFVPHTGDPMSLPIYMPPAHD